MAAQRNQVRAGHAERAGLPRPMAALRPARKQARSAPRHLRLELQRERAHVKSALDLLRRADHWIFAPEDARRLAAVRIGLCSLLALRLTMRNYDAVAEQAHFQPHFYMQLFERMPS